MYIFIIYLDVYGNVDENANVDVNVDVREDIMKLRNPTIYVNDIIRYTYFKDT